MKIFIINLDRSSKRRIFMESQLQKLGLEYEIFQAVEGKKLTEREIDQYCNKAAIERAPQWLTKGAIGCALSHLFLYRKIIEEKIDQALILEDDILLNKDLIQLINRLSSSTKKIDKYITLLYATSFSHMQFLKKGSVKISGKYSLYHCKNPQYLLSAGAYIITNAAACRLYHNLLPIRVAADTWGYFLKEGYIDDIVCVVPYLAKPAFFESDIGYVGNPYLKQARNIVAKTPIIKRFLIYNRWRQWRKMTRWKFID